MGQREHSIPIVQIYLLVGQATRAVIVTGRAGCPPHKISSSALRQDAPWGNTDILSP
jgi:hypothetical protein